MKRLAKMALAVGFTVTAAAHADCLQQYRQLYRRQQQIRKERAASAGTGSVGLVGAALTVAIGSTGIGTVGLLIVGAGGVYLAYRKYGQEQQVTREIDVLTLYRQSREFLVAKQTNTQAQPGLELAAFVAGLGAKKNVGVTAYVASLIVQGMEQGGFCSDHHLVDTAELLQSLRAQ